MSVDQKIRTFLYYTSVSVFLIGLPFILAFSLSYKFDRRSFKFTRTGIISVKSQPPGATVTLDGQQLPDKTPMSISELLPGMHTVALELDGYYPYERRIEVEGGKVARMEKVILFPLRSDTQQVNKEKISFFWLDEQSSALYFINRDENTLFRSDMDGGRFEQVCTFVPIAPAPRKWVFSPDRSRLAYFNQHRVGITELPQGKKRPAAAETVILDFPSDVINDMFWYADSYHIILMCRKRILICEARSGAVPVGLVNLAKRNSTGFYDSRTDSLYFMDSQQALDGNVYDNLYRLEMRNRVYPFTLPDFINLKGLEQRMNLLDWRPEDKKDGKKP
ncbi:MAG TPA: PEGA domain-containing protein [Candidatus Omnitrophota bacterium]|nr:PEGA domain-containing protein [Candidatus Omnitrophota bacterium]